MTANLVPSRRVPLPNATRIPTSMVGDTMTWIYALPLAFVISLVYNASRYEMPAMIIIRAARQFVMILIFMLIVFAFLYLLSYGL